jgi:peptidylprolyl isomerase
MPSAPLACTTVRRPVLAVLAVLLASLALAACGGSSDSDSTSTATTGTSGASSDLATSAPAMPKPKVTVPKGKAPTQLVVKDLKKGTGAVVAPGETLKVNYVGVLYDNGKEFDTNFGKLPLMFPIGTGQVIQGWDKGLIGMRVGGRRELIIPPDLAYGSQRSGKIPPNSTLVFDVDLLGVT